MNNIKEHPIILTAQEVNAVLAGHKTQYRAPIKMRYGSPDFLGSRDCNKSDPSIWGWDNFEDSETQVLSNEPCPFGVIGDRLWVQELHARTDRNDHLTRPHYYADGTLRPDLRHDAGLLIKYSAEDMPRWASRLLLEITDIRIERVQDISEDDALELGGVESLSIDGGHTWKYGLLENSVPFDDKEDNESYYWSKWSLDYKDAVMCLWDNIHSKGAWDRNDWVWVIEFKAIEGVNHAN